MTLNHKLEKTAAELAVLTGFQLFQPAEVELTDGEETHQKCEQGQDEKTEVHNLFIEISLTWDFLVISSC